MGTFEIILLSGLVLGVAQLGAGVAIGLWIGRRRSDQSDWNRAHQIAADLDSITAQVSDSLQDHADKLGAVDDRLRREVAATEGTHGPLTDLVVGVVGELLSANSQLASDLQHSRDELAQRMDELNEHRKQANTDALTGLPNRRAFDDRLRDCVDSWRKRQAPFTLMMIDVDRFKQFNDTHGHQAGDAALKTVADALGSSLRNHDFVARYGGEEFAVLLPYTTIDNAAPAVEKALASVEAASIPTPSGTTSATISIGVAEIQLQERSEALIERSDNALYAAKENGRNQAWMHDGTGLAAFASVEAISTEVATDVRQACDDLSASLADFMGQSAAESADPLDASRI